MENSEEGDQNKLSRTILVYLAGDNNESKSIEAVIEKIKNGSIDKGCNCIIYHDGLHDPSKLFRVRTGCCKHGGSYLEEIATYPEENSASAIVLNRVIKDVVTLFPAESYGLIFTSHASGWLPYTDRPITRSIGEDDTTGKEASAIELSDFAKAIPDHQFDFIIFETCLMAGIEVAYELKDKTKYILASSAELLSPGFVPIYEKSFTHLTNKSSSVAVALKQFGEDYMSYINNKNGAWKSATLSLINTTELESLAEIAKSIFKNKSSDMFIPIRNIQHFDRPTTYGDMNIPTRFFDFEQTLHLMGDSEQNKKLSAQLSKVVIWKSSTTSFLIPGNYNGFNIQHHSGLTIFVENEQSPQLNLIYKKTSWYKRISQF